MIVYFGLGSMGLPMAIHATKAGQELVGCDPSPERRALLQREGAVAVADASDALTRADGVVITVGSQPQVDTIVTGAGGVLERCRPGTLVLVVSTVSPHFVEQLGQQAAAKGIRLVDAPVCRAESGAASGTLLALLSGEEADCHEAAKIMKPFTSDTKLIGNHLGDAQVAKTANNMILWACALANEEALKLADSWRLDAGTLRDALTISTADNWCLRNWDQVGQMPWSIKDMSIALEAAKDKSLELPFAETISRLVRTSSVLSHA